MGRSVSYVLSVRKRVLRMHYNFLYVLCYNVLWDFVRDDNERFIYMDVKRNALKAVE